MFMCVESPFAEWRLMKLTQFESMFPSMASSSLSIPWSDLITKGRRANEVEHVMLRNRRSWNNNGLNGSLSMITICTSSVNRWSLGNLSRIIKRYSLVVSFRHSMERLISCGFDFTNTFVYLSKSRYWSKVKSKWRRDGMTLLSLKK